MTKRSLDRIAVSIFAALAAASLIFWWHPLAATFGLASANDAYTHILLILPLSAALVYLDLKDRKTRQKRYDSEAASKSNLGHSIGAVLLTLAFLVGCYGRWGMPAATDDIRLSLEMFSLVAWWISAVVFSFGLRALRALLLPLGLLFLLIPAPAVVLDSLVRWLQYGSAWMAAFLLHTVGESVQRNGIFLNLASVNIEVAKECSSIRSSCLLVITTIVLAHLFLRSWWRNLLLVLVAIPISIFKNGLRIFVITELGTRVDQGFFEGSFHHHGGIVFLLIALAINVGLLAILRRTETREPEVNAIPSI
jgi:exosortase